MFGPRGAGKTVLVNAFRGTLHRHYESVISNQYMIPFLPEFSGDLDYLKRPAQTERRTPYIVKFGRKPKNVHDDRQLVSSHIHEMRIYDNKGGLFGAGSDIRVKNIEDLMKIPAFKAAWQDLIDNAISIVVTLDPTGVKDGIAEKVYSDVDDDTDKNEELDHIEAMPNQPKDIKARWEQELLSKGNLSITEWATMINRLNELTEFVPMQYVIHSEDPKYPDGIQKEINIRRKIAICVVKADVFANEEEIQIMDGDKKNITIMEYFSGATETETKRLSQKFDVKVFYVSSSGYFMGESNISDDTERKIVKDEHDWQAYNAHLPFLWVMQELEKEVIKSEFPETRWRSSKIDDYIGYF